jgi:demethylmenaquinone methyltransferase/2-methoxy-6-polyprenyl-1,4-benzoquinol methylase
MAKTTHFGYREVDVENKQGVVRLVFVSVAGKYYLMNVVL